MGFDTFLIGVGVASLALLAGYGFGWRDGMAHEQSEGEGEGWIDEALEWRALIKAAAMRDMKLPTEDEHEST